MNARIRLHAIAAGATFAIRDFEDEALWTFLAERG
jgi:hypothetical protein